MMSMEQDKEVCEDGEKTGGGKKGLVTEERKKDEGLKLEVVMVGSKGEVVIVVTTGGWRGSWKL